MRYFLLLGFLLGITLAQDTLIYNDGGTIFLQSGAEMTIEGSLVNTSGSQLTNYGGEIALSGNWTNNGTHSFIQGGQIGRTTFVGSDSATIYADLSSTNVFGRLEIAKTYQTTVFSNNNMIIYDSLNLNGGILRANQVNYILINNPAQGIISGYSLPGSAVDDRYIQDAYLRRAINANIGLDFPVGGPPTSRGYQFLRITVRARNGATVVDGSFWDGVSGTPPNQAECGAFYDCMLSQGGGHGRYYARTNSPSSAIDIAVAPRNFAAGCGGGTYTLINGSSFSGAACLGFSGSLDPVNGTLITRLGIGNSPNLFVTGSANSFPVEWLDFTAEAQGPDALLQWSTASEVNNEGFEVQRADENGNFLTIGQVEGNGTTQQISDYQYIDPHPGAGTHYYRLRQIDLDGQSELSEVRSVRFEDIPFLIGPNPFDREIALSYPASGQGAYTFVLINALGQPVLQRRLSGSGRDVLALQDLPEGVYTYQLKMPAFPVQQGKLVCVH